MPMIDIQLDGDNCWPDIPVADVLNPSKSGEIVGLAYLKGGMSSGKPSVTFRCKMKDGSTVLVETSAGLLIMAAAAVKGKALHDGFDV